jgi:hypothetical protein
MIDLAMALTNNTGEIKTDVENIYALEKNISQVIFEFLFEFLNNIYSFSIIGLTPNNVVELMKQSEQLLVIFPVN